MVGQTLAHYRIVEKLGEGGMGVVYKARDTHLDRFVALKVLPPEKLTDPERRRRFVQEAKAASALNHPNIITVHDIVEDCIVMEYIEGKALDQLIGRKGLRLNDALRYAIQIAGALTKAHAAGIVHRDLKPSNIMVTGDGLVKVLDFGLAKLTEPVEPASAGEVAQASACETATARAKSAEGAIVGTVAYMSPEQAEGKPVDARSDIFSFGAVLYEMVTGRRAFHGDSVPSTLAAVIKEPPKPLGELVPDLPRDLEKLILRCLQKDRERRWQGMGDLPVLLRELQEESDSQPAGANLPTVKATRRWWLAALAALPLALGGGWLIWRHFNPASAPPRVVQLTAYQGSELYPSFSPDGSQVAFARDGAKGDNPDIYVKLVGEDNALRLTTDPARDEWPAWSTDGKRIAFWRSAPGRETAIYLVSPLGGAEQKLAEFPGSGQISWSPDGKWLAVARQSASDRGIYLLPIEGGEPRRMTNSRTPAIDYHPAFSLAGRSLAYASCPRTYSCDVYVQELDAGYALRGLPRRITRQELWIGGIAWAGDSLVYSGSLSWMALEYLWRVKTSGESPPERLELAGVPARYPAVARAGNRLAFSRLLRNRDIWRYRPGGSPALLIASSLDDGSPQFSPDGNRIAFGSSRSGETFDIWVVNADGSNPVQLTYRLGRGDGSPRWSPDGRWIAFDSLRPDGYQDICVIDATGGRPRRLTSESCTNGIPSWSRDGKWIYFFSDRTGRREIWRVAASGGKAERITDNGGETGVESADSKTLFYTKGLSSPLFARPLAGGPERQVLDYVGASRYFAVFEDGIYYSGRSENGQTPLLFYQFSTGVSRLLTRIEGLVGQGLSVSPDRRTVLFLKSATSGADLMLIENFR